MPTEFEHVSLYVCQYGQALQSCDHLIIFFNKFTEKKKFHFNITFFYILVKKKIYKNSLETKLEIINRFDEHLFKLTK